MKGNKPCVIIGVHGLGNKPSRELLQKWWLEAMKEGLRGIGKPSELPAFELVYWADILNRKPLDESITNMDDLYYLDERYVPAPVHFTPEDHPIRRKIMYFLERHMDRMLLKEDFTLKFPYLSEVVINKYFYELGLYFNNNGIGKAEENRETRKLIRRRVASAIKKYHDHEIFLVAHSMGSIVAFDVLSLDIPEIEISTFATIGSPLGIPVILSKIATNEEYKQRNGSIPTTPPGVHKWYNFSDPDDRISFDHTLSDDFVENNRGVRAVDVSVFNNFVCNGLRNPHKSFGYLRTKEFAETLTRFIEARVCSEKPGFADKVKKVWQSFFNRAVSVKSVGTIL